MKTKTSPTQRSLKWLRDQGYIAAVVEQNVRIPAMNGQPAKMFKRDLFGFVDIVAMKADVMGTTFIQVTAGLGSHRTERQAKMEAADALRPMLAAGNSCEFHAWRKVGKRGARKLWKLARFQARLHGEAISWLTMNEDELEATPPQEETCSTGFGSNWQ